MGSLGSRQTYDNNDAKPSDEKIQAIDDRLVPQEKQYKLSLNLELRSNAFSINSTGKPLVEKNRLRRLSKNIVFNPALAEQAKQPPLKADPSNK